jgi:hypothetical protein
MRNRIIKTLVFDDPVREDITLSDPSKVRLNTEFKKKKKNRQVQLKKQGRYYPTDPDLYVETTYFTGEGLLEWQGFQAILNSPVSTLDIPENTDVKFKVKVPSGNYYWDGAAWSIAGLSDWNTEKEINDNLSSFPIATLGRNIACIIKLVSVDGKATPFLHEIKVLGLYDVDLFKDIIYDTIIRDLQINLRSHSEIVFPTSSSTSAIDLATIDGVSSYNVTGIKRVFDLNDDPDRFVDLFDSYTPGSLKDDNFTYEPGTVNLNAPVPANHWIKIELEYVPEIVVKVGQDYFEAPKYPTILFTQIAEIFKFNFVMRDTNSYGQDYIVTDKVNGDAVMQYSPTQKNFRVNFSIYAGRQIDQLNLSRDFIDYLSNKKIFTSYGLGYDFGTSIIEDFNNVGNSTKNDSTDTNLSSGVFDLWGLLFYNKQSIDVPLVTNFNLEADIEREDE